LMYRLGISFAKNPNKNPHQKLSTIKSIFPIHRNSLYTPPYINS
jgi:hypothetical protein